MKKIILIMLSVLLIAGLFIGCDDGAVKGVYNHTASTDTSSTDTTSTDTTPTYIVSFNSNGGSSVPSQTVLHGEKATTPTDPTKDGYYLDEWYSDSDLTTLYDFETSVTDNKTLYAKWVPNGFVDLGVKNSADKPLYWAKCNLGASSAEDYGYYYAWASTTGYTYDGSKWVDKDNTEIPSGGFITSNTTYYIPGTTMEYSKYTTSATLESSDDAATVKNSSWRMPTTDEFVKLAANCVWIWTSNYNGTGKSGYIVYKAKNDGDKGKANMNGTWKKWSGSSYVNDTPVTGTYSISDPHHIFLPAAGYVQDVTLNDVNTNGYYWTSSHTGTMKNANALFFNSNVFSLNANSLRNRGFSIRPVRED